MLATLTGQSKSRCKATCLINSFQKYEKKSSELVSPFRKEAKN